MTPPVDPPDYGKSLRGLTLNLLSSDLARSVQFHQRVLDIEPDYADADIALFDAFGVRWMLHADHTYDKHPLHARVSPVIGARGIGLEIRLHELDPDAAAQRAVAAGFEVFDGPRDQPDHGLREAHIIDADGYVWVPDVPLA